MIPGPLPTQCDYITDAPDLGQLHCQLDRGHDGDHVPVAKFRLIKPVWRKYDARAEDLFGEPKL